ncbi:hypothetical protein B0H10DRAFT_2439344 [Mycena sp. CBHHK59/15]|nr:hypothetical protein B0H10DRAFT_2439344 [Mycena sp. CBHHK59/15]
MSAEQLLAKYDLEKFIWKPLATNDGGHCLARPLAGSELVQELWNRFEKGNQNLFFAVELDLVSPHSEAALLAAARDAWIALRHQFPIITTVIDRDEHDVPMFKYCVPNAAELKRWKREQAGPYRIPSIEKTQTWMHLVPGPRTAAGLVTQICFMLGTHRAVADGNGAKTITNQYHTEFGKRLGSGQTDALSLPWGQEVYNLTPAIFNVLGGGGGTPTLSPFQAALTRNLPSPIRCPRRSDKFSFSTEHILQNQYGFKARDADPGQPNARRVAMLFTKGESENLLGYMKTQPYTLTVLARAINSLFIGARVQQKPNS